MSASAEPIHQDARSKSLRSRQAEISLWSVSAVWVALLAWELVRHRDQIASHALILVPWSLLLLGVDLFPLTGWSSSTFTFDEPVITAAALALTPIEAGLVIFLGHTDV